jgi:hypothetical protein
MKKAEPAGLDRRIQLFCSLVTLPLKSIDLAICPTGTLIRNAAVSAVGVDSGSDSGEERLWAARNWGNMIGDLAHRAERELRVGR